MKVKILVKGKYKDGGSNFNAVTLAENETVDYPDGYATWLISQGLAEAFIEADDDGRKVVELLPVPENAEPEPVKKVEPVGAELVREGKVGRKKKG